MDLSFDKFHDDDDEEFVVPPVYSKGAAIQRAIGILESYEIPVEVLNKGVHLKIGKGGKVDFYPTTGTFYCAQTKAKGKGLEEALKLLKSLEDTGPSLSTAKKPEGLTACQSKAFDAIIGPRNVFLTGEAGTGKSFLVSSVRRQLKRASYPILAPTGVAALLVGGQTIHSYFGFGRFENAAGAVRNALKDELVLERMRAIEGVFLDEISMVSGPLLEAMEEVARKARRSSKPWGGLKVVAVGDFRQLPPVNTASSKKEWAFLSPVWKHSEFEPALLREPMRQAKSEFTMVLNCIRSGVVVDKVAQFLDSRVTDIRPEDFKGTMLFGTNERVDALNNQKLEALPGELYEIETEYEGSKAAAAALEGRPIPKVLQLKVGARVMMRLNDMNGRFVNGSLGDVVEIGDNGIGVELTTGDTIWVERAEFKVTNDHGTVVATARNFPMTLAWATSIHKSQGCTLDMVLIDLRKLWDSGQAYVALSRARKPEGIFLMGWDRNSIKADPQVDAFHRAIMKK